MTANDPKLSDGGGLAQPVPNGGPQESQTEPESAPDAEAQAVTDRSGSLQRMVRPRSVRFINAQSSWRATDHATGRPYQE